MADTFTTNLNLTKPEPGAAEDTWGISLNSDLDTLDAIFSSSGTQVNLNPNQVNFADDKKAIFGSANSLKISHDGTDALITNDTGDFVIRNTADDKDIILQSDNGSGGLVAYITLDGSEVHSVFARDAKFTDGTIAKFGNAEDLQIYHDGSHSYITDSGTGDLLINATNLRLRNVGGVNMLYGQAGGWVKIYYNGSEKFETTNTGVNVTGTATMDGLTVDGGLATINSSGANSDLILTEGSTNTDARIRNSNGILQIGADINNEFGASEMQFSVDGKEFLSIDRTGDISFYDDTGTTQGLFWDASTERLGIGTTSPSTPFSVHSALVGGVAIAEFRSTGNAHSYLDIRADGTGDPKIFFDLNGATAFAIGVDNSDSDKFKISGHYQLGTNDRFVIDSSGNTGIGTSSPSSILHVSSDSTPTIKVTDTTNDVTGTFYANNFDSYLSSTSRLIFQAGGSIAATISASQNFGIGTTSPSEKLTIDAGNIALDDNRYITWGSNTGRVKISGNESLDDIRFNTDNSERMRLTNTGLGIGTSSPSYLLDVESSSTGNVTLAQFKTNESTYNGLLVAANNNAGWIGNGTLVADEGILFQDTSSAMRFYTASSERMRIDGSGNVGIGTSSPNQKLNVSGGRSYFGANSEAYAIGVGYNGTRTAANQTYFIGATDATAPDLQFSNSDGDEKVRITHAGNIGIGTSSPSRTVDIHGDIGIQNPSYFSGAYDWSFSQNGTNGGLGIKYYGSEKVTVTNNGDVGIGDTSPSAKLDVTSATHAAHFTSTGDQVPVRIISDQVSNVSTIGFQGANSTNSYNVRAGADSDDFVIYTANTERLRIDSTGLVGIGTSSPQDKLSIEGGNVSINNGSAFQVGGSVSGNTVIGTLKSESGVLTLKADSTRDVQFGSETNGTAMFIEGSNGNVGIGTDNPVVTLNVDSNAQNEIARFQGANAQLRIDNNTLNVINLNSGGSGDALSLSTGGSEAIRIEDNQNVGIGTTAPSAKLHVSGTTNLSDHITLSRGGGQFITKNDNSQYVLISGGNSGDSGQIILGGGTNGTYTGNILFRTGTTTTSEVGRFDSSGNLLVGKTAADISTDGIELGTRVESTADGTYPLRLNRRSSDGEIINFRKDGANVGSIGTASNTLVVGSTDGSGSYLKFGSNVVAPVDVNGTVRDNAIDLGQTNARFTNLHLSGVANVGDGIQSTQTTTGFGYLNFGDTDDANVGQIGYDHTSNYMRFQVNNTEKARIDSSGNFLVGKTGTGVNQTGFQVVSNKCTITNDGDNTLILNRQTSDGVVTQYRKDGTTVGSVQVTDTATTYNTSSDARLKDVTGEARGLEVITKLNPVAYNWKADGKADEGLIAQEVKEIVPNAVSGSEDEHYQMDYSKLVTHLVAGMKEQQEQIESLKSEIAKLKGE